MAFDTQAGNKKELKFIKRKMIKTESMILILKSSESASTRNFLFLNHVVAHSQTTLIPEN